MISFVRVFESIPEQHRFIEPTIENVVCGGGAAAQREKKGCWSERGSLNRTLAFRNGEIGALKWQRPWVFLQI